MTPRTPGPRGVAQGPGGVRGSAGSELPRTPWGRLPQPGEECVSGHSASEEPGVRVTTTVSSGRTDADRPSLRLTGEGCRGLFGNPRSDESQSVSAARERKRV